jgi:hypothetical protein
MKTAVEWLEDEVDRIVETYDVDMMRCYLEEAYEKAKEMEKEQDIYLLRWMAANVIEVQGGWEYDGWTYSDEGILEVYYKK